jgi:hypothetical protein
MPKESLISNLKLIGCVSNKRGCFGEEKNIFGSVGPVQGDQIGRIFAYWGNCLLVAVFWKLLK